MSDYRFYGADTADVRDENGLTPRFLYDLLTHIWCAETCAPRMRRDWSPENPTLGQCSVTAFLAQDLFGGAVYGIPLGDGNFHCYNVVDGQAFDLTSEQFGEAALQYENDPGQSREAHFAKEEKYARYLLLRRRLMAEYAVLLKHSGYNCCQAVLCAYARGSGLPAETLKKLGAGFGVGMGCMEATCGGLCAAQMLLGLARYRGAPMLKEAKALHEAFAKACGASVCRELKGVGSGDTLCECDDCVRNAVRVLEQALETGRKQ